jgi:Ca2+-binding RTX toxin-like protein
MIRSLITVVALVAAQGVALAGTASADASSVRVERGQLIFQAAAGQANRLTISGDGPALVLADAVPMIPGTGCDRVTATQVSCPSTGITAVTIHLRDGDDAGINSASTAITMHGEDGADTLYGGEVGDSLFGGEGDDTLYGGPGSDVLHGEKGMDTLLGGDDPDSLWGGSENEKDLIDGGNGAGMRDTVFYSDRTVSVTVDLVTGTGGVAGEGDELKYIGSVNTGDGNDTIVGDDLPNNLDGGKGDDTIKGGDGDDVLKGGDGDDTLIGGGPDGTTKPPPGDDCYPGGQQDDEHSECEAVS